MTVPEPPPLTPPRLVPERPVAAGRVALGLVIFGVLDLTYSIASFVYTLLNLNWSEGQTVHLSMPGTFVVLWLCAWLVWRDKRFVWPIIAYMTAFGLGAIVGSAIAVGSCVPMKLIHAIAAQDRGNFIVTSGYSAVTAALLIWLAFESHRVDWGSVLPRPRTRWLQPISAGAIGAVLSGVIVFGIVSAMTASWTKPVIERARRQLGPEYASYDYFVSSYQSKTTNGHTKYQAVVVAYSETEYNWIKLNWEN